MSKQLFDTQCIDLNLNTNEKFETILHLANLAKERILDVDKYILDVKAREEFSTTGIGEGIAIPHAKSEFVKIPTVIVGKSARGIEWESIDNKPVNMIFLIAVPSTEDNAHLKILQSLAIALMDDDFKNELLNLEDKQNLVNLLIDKTNS